MIDLDEILAAPVARGELIGVAAAVRTPAGVETGAAGLRSEGAAMTPDTVVWIASMTKAVTTVAAMGLVEQGHLDLDAPWGDLVPYLGRVQVLDGFTEDGSPVLRPPTSPVTLRRLLNHTAGFGYGFTDASLLRYEEWRGEKPEGSTESLEQPVLFDPGQRWTYGINVDWVGQVIEAVTKVRLDEHLRSAIFDPLGMVDTGFRRDQERRARTADMFIRIPEGLEHIPFEPREDTEVVMAGGGLYSTVTDYLRFLGMILGGGAFEGTRILGPGAVREMAANQVGNLSVPGWKSANPRLSNDVELRVGDRFGLGFVINTARGVDGRAPGSMAWGGLANTYYWVDPESQVAGVLATQVLPFFDGPSLATFGAFERAVYASL